MFLRITTEVIHVTGVTMAIVLTVRHTKHVAIKGYGASGFVATHQMRRMWETPEVYEESLLHDKNFVDSFLIKDKRMIVWQYDIVRTPTQCGRVLITRPKPVLNVLTVSMKILSN